MSTEYGTGAIVSVPDYGDYKFSELVFTDNLPFEKLPDHTIIENQSLSKKCVAMAVSTAVEIMLNNSVIISPDYIYVNIPEWADKGEGYNIKDALYMAHKYGVCTIQDFPYKKAYRRLLEPYFVTNKKYYYKKAENYKIGNYFKVDPTNIQEMKRAIAEFGFVIISIKTGKDFKNVGDDGLIPYETQPTGYHSVILTGYDKYGRYILQNSYGESWGKNGTGYLPLDYDIKEAWTFCSPDYSFNNDKFSVVYSRICKTDTGSNIEYMAKLAASFTRIFDVNFEMVVANGNVYVGIGNFETEHQAELALSNCRLKSMLEIISL